MCRRLFKRLPLVVKPLTVRLYNGVLLLKVRFMNTPGLTAIRSPEVMPFIYSGCRFVCEVEHVSAEAFQPHVRYESGMPGIDSMALQDDAAPYRTTLEAMRHAQQQAIRWVHDHQGDGTGRF